MGRFLLVFVVILFSIEMTSAQKKPMVPDTIKKVARPVIPTALPKPKDGPKPYRQVITDKSISKSGLVKVHKVDDKYYFELADSVLGREILVVNRISKSGAEVRASAGYAGDQIGSSVIQFVKGPGNRIFLRKISYTTYSPDSTKSMYQAVQRSNIQAIAASFPIAAFAPDKKGNVIDVTDYVNSENEIFSFSSALGKSRIRLGNFIADRSYISNIRSFPKNVEITTVKTYALTAPVSSTPSAPASGNLSGSSTIEINSSMVVLPVKPMQARYFDARVGYFTVGYTDFDANPQGIKQVEMIKRWRLEPKVQDLEKYRRGELVEPQTPIVFYIDPATPAKWVPYLIAGVNDWQKAFEKAGFKNAIIGKLAPTASQDSTWSLDDARHSAIVYKPSEIANASGPSIADPRSGEIFESHINWYHNVMQLVHDWYMIQAAAIDPRARKMEFSDELMGDLIRFVSSHEVGHTIGLRHNYGSSSTVPVENLRNKKWVEENGHTPSIMDYARFNYVAQPEDNISPKGIYPRIGDYDLWAIEWGYRLPDMGKSAEQEVASLNQLTIEKAKNRRLWFGTESNADDPHSQSEDLGDNSMKASAYGIKNLQRITLKLSEWTKSPNQDYSDLKNMYGQLTGQYNRYMGHVVKNVAGVYENPKTVEQSGVIYTRVPATIQKEAMFFLNEQLFTTPQWLLNKNILDNIGANSLQTVSRSQNIVLNRLISVSTFNKLITAEAMDGSKAYTITNLFNDLNRSIFKELISSTPIDVYRRNLQKMYVDNLIDILKPDSPAITSQTAGRVTTIVSPAMQSDGISIVKAELKRINLLLKNAVPKQSVSLSKYHLQDLSDRINQALNPR